jgi:hypothetical protein
VRQDDLRTLGVRVRARAVEGGRVDVEQRQIEALQVQPPDATKMTRASLERASGSSEERRQRERARARSSRTSARRRRR